MRYSIVVFLSCLAALSGHASQTYTPPAFTDSERGARITAVLPKLDALYRDYATAQHLPGMLYGVVVDGKLVHTLALGTANLTTKTQVSLDTRFRIASMSKSFTALAILKLRDAAKLSLDDPVAKYFPSFSRVGPLTEDSPPVTLRLLLKMAGGFPQDDPWGDRLLAASVPELESLVGNGLSYSNPPGTIWEYSNLGYGLLGQVITQVAGEPYQAYITREILLPLGMHDTVFEFAEIHAGAFALGYRWERDQWTPEPILHDGTFGAMGGLITTVGDFAKYVAFHLDAWPPRNDQEVGPVSRATRREMHRPADVIAVVADHKTRDGQPNPRVAGYSFGLSWNLDARGIIWVRHAGGLPGYGSEFRFLPDHGIGLIAFANLTYAPMTTINAQAMELLVDTAKAPARTLPPSPALVQRRTQLITLIQDWNHPVAADALSSNFFLDKASDDWAALSRELLAKAGKISSATDVVPLNQLRGTFEFIGEHGRLKAFFTLMPEATPRVQALTLTFVPNPAAAEPASNK